MTTPMRSTRRWYPRHFWLGIAIAGAIIAIVLGPWVVTLVLMFGGFLLEHWLWSWAITATIVAITQTIRLIVGRRRP